MCGLSGIVGTINSTKDFDVFRNLLIFNMVRGEDSTGVGIVPRYDTADIRTLKVLGPACDLINNKKFDQTLHSGWSKVWLGHNRSATTGSVQIKNAHPFHFDGILGMHNGTIDQHSRGKMKDHLLFGTDSEALIWNIQLYGVDKIIPELEGSWTLVWYDPKKNSINMLRNEKRPLAYVFSEDEKVMYFGSELDTLAGALRRNAVKWKDKFSILPENIWYSWEVPKDGKKFEEPTRKHVEGYKWVNTAPQKKSSDSSGSRINHASYSAEPTSSITKPGFQAGPRGAAEPAAQTSASRNSGTNLIVPGRPDVPTKDITKEPDYVKGPEQADGMYAWMHLKQTRVYRNIKGNTWLLATLNQDKSWNVKETRQAPKFLRFTNLDINANHAFKHQGKKKHKIIFFKGWKGTMLTRPDFEKVVGCGCASCARTDIQWGNQVLFVNDKHDFLCEWCMMDTPLVKSWFGHAIPNQNTPSVAVN